jgi:LuxR family maltose regulon positive regulatory protein
VRTHTKNIYGKLGVNSRQAGVRRAVELGLLPQTRSTGSQPVAARRA